MKILQTLYDKSRLWFALAWIIAYCLLMSLADLASAVIGVKKSVTFLVGALLSAFLLCFLHKNELMGTYGICRSSTPAKRMLFYIPIFILLTANFWNGFTVNYGIMETILYILSMFCVGFLEEVIFRGLLFDAMAKDNFKVAIIVSSLTFGFGHIINLLNGSGTELVSNLLQVIYATAAGFMFVMIYVRTRSLIICIITHGLFNALSAFSAEASATIEMSILSCVLLTLITGLYAIYLAVKNQATGKSTELK